MNINIVVPCYNGEDFVPVFFKSISLVIIPDGVNLHLILVDNGSNDNSLSLLKTNSLAITNFKTSVLEYPNVKSSYAARNFGANHAKCDFLVFTDIDCMLPEDYFIKLSKLIKAESSDFIVAGNVLLQFSSNPNIYECYDYIFGFNINAYSRESTGVTANAIVPYDVFLISNGFDVVESGGDRGFFKRVVNELYVRFIYADDLHVFHPCRNSYQELISKVRRVGRGLSVNYRKFTTVQKLKRLMITIGTSFIQLHQIKILANKRKFIFGLNPTKGLLLIFLVFWLGLYGRMFIFIQMTQKN